MKTTTKYPALELGRNTMSVFTSVTNMCVDIYKNSKSNNTILEKISKKVDSLVTILNKIPSPLTSIVTNTNNMNNGLYLMLGSSMTTNLLLEEMVNNSKIKPINNFSVNKNDELAELISFKFDNLVEVGISINKRLAKFLDSFDANKSRPEKNDPIFSELKAHTKLLNLISKNKGSSSGDTKPTKETKEKSSSVFDVIGSFAESVANLAKNLTSKFVKNFDVFILKFEKLLNPNTEKRFETFADGFDKFSKIFTNTGGLTKSIALLSLAFFGLTLAFASPLVAVSLFMFTAWVKILSSIFADKNTDKGIKDFAMGIAILTLAMFGMEFIPWWSGLKMLMFIGGLGLLFDMFKFDKVGTGNPIIMVATALAILTLCLFAFEYVEWGSVAKMLLFVAGLGLIFTFFKFDRLGVGNPIIMVATALAILTLCLFAFEYIEWSSVGKMLAFVAGMGAIFALFKFKSASIDMLFLAGSLAVMAGVLYFVSTIDLTMEKVLIFAGSIAIFGLIYAAISLVSTQILIGSVAMGVMFGSLLIGAASLYLISKFDVDKDRVYNFMLSVGILVAGFALLALPAVLGAVGAAAFIPIAISSLIGGLILSGISALAYDPKNVYGFMLSAGILVSGFALLAVPAVLGAVGAALFIPIAVASLIGAIVLSKVSSVKVNINGVTNLIKGMSSLVDGINEIGLWDLTKTAAKAVLLYPILKASLLATGVLTKISENASKINMSSVSSLGGFLTQFVDTMVVSLQSNASKVESLEPSVNTIAKLLNIVGSLGKVIGDVSNLNFNTYGVQNGKLVITGTRKLNDTDFANVGKNILTMLTSLIAPLNNIGNGTLVTSATKDGMDIIKDIASSFNPLVDVITKYSNLKIATDPKLTRIMSNSLLLLSSTFVVALNKLSTLKMGVINRSISNIKDFMELFEDADKASIIKLENVMNKFVNTMASNKWSIIHKNLKQMQSEFVGISKAVNSIDLQKAMTFERTVKTLATQQNSDALLQTVEQLKELLSINKQTQTATETTASVISTGETKTGSSFFGGIFGDPKEEVKAKKEQASKPTKIGEKLKQKQDPTQIVAEGLNELSMAMNAILGKLGGNLKVILVDDQSNSKRI